MRYASAGGRNIEYAEDYELFFIAASGRGAAAAQRT